ncbi:MAG: HU family DNA-binding protein [Deltaproteobacteria bacterium]|jgi:nucleoid DNA-binding protein|nr:HU family DNA-binding protein [Deltaproteobacteria bacterium]
MTSTSTPLTRAELIQILRERLSISSKDANRIIESALDAISDSLAKNGTVSLIGLGRFQVKLTPARPGRNPKTGAYAEVPKHFRPTFTMSRSLRDRLMDYGQKHLALGKVTAPGNARKGGKGNGGDVEA